MFKFRKSGKVLLGMAAAVIAAAAGVIGTAAFDADTVILKEYEQPQKEDCMTVGITGSYLTDTDTALAKINTARFEACRDGYPDPADPSRKLTINDFVPAQYSSDLENVARIRSAEAVLIYGHTRPNGDSCFSVDAGASFKYQAESLAWNNSGSVTNGLDQFLKEKEDWLKQTKGAITGHYTQMINPANRYVGIGCFKSEDTTGYSTALCVRYGRSEENLDGTKGEEIKNCIVPVQIPEENFDNIKVKTVSGKKTINAGATAEFELRGTASFDYTSGNTTSTWKSDVVLYNTKWESSDPDVARIDDYGKVIGLKSGVSSITAADGDNAIRFKLTVNPSIDECTVTIPYSSYTYRGRGIKPTVTVKYNGTKLVKNTDYTVAYIDNVNVGTAKIVVTGKGKYSGTKQKNFTVKPLDLTSSYAKVTIPYSSYTYTGKNIKPAVKVKFKSGDIIPEDQYSVSYYANLRVGKARIYITAKGDNLKQSFIKEFVIKPEKNAIVSLTTAKGAFKVTWKKATAGASGYQVVYSTTPDFSDNVHSYTSKDLDDLTENFSKVPKEGETWYIKVRSFVEQNNTRYGNYSAVSSITVK